MYVQLVFDAAIGGCGQNSVLKIVKNLCVHNPGCCIILDAFRSLSHGFDPWWADANIDSTDKLNQTALLWCGAQGHTDIARILMDAKANPDFATTGAEMKEHNGRSAVTVGFS